MTGHFRLGQFIKYFRTAGSQGRSSLLIWFNKLSLLVHFWIKDDSDWQWENSCWGETILLNWYFIWIKNYINPFSVVFWFSLSSSQVGNVVRFWESPEMIFPFWAKEELVSDSTFDLRDFLRKLVTYFVAELNFSFWSGASVKYIKRLYRMAKKQCQRTMKIRAMVFIGVSYVRVKILREPGNTAPRWLDQLCYWWTWHLTTSYSL